MDKIMIIILAIAGLLTSVLLNVIIRRLIAGVRSREDYDEDVDGTMSKAEKKAAEEAKVLEAEKKNIGLKAVWNESPAKFSVVMILGTVIGGLAGFRFGFSLNAIIYFLLFMILIIIAFVDLATMEIPPVLNYIILGLGIISIFTDKDVTILQRLIGLVCISGFMLIVTLIVKGAFGGGDIKLMAAAGFLMGWKGILTAYLFGLFLGAAIGIILMVRRKKGGKEHMPFGPSLCMGIVAASVFGAQLIDWYINIIKLSMPNTFS